MSTIPIKEILAFLQLDRPPVAVPVCLAVVAGVLLALPATAIAEMKLQWLVHDLPGCLWIALLFGASIVAWNASLKLWALARMGWSFFVEGQRLAWQLSDLTRDEKHLLREFFYAEEHIVNLPTSSNPALSLLMQRRLVVQIPVTLSPYAAQGWGSFILNPRIAKRVTLELVLLPPEPWSLETQQALRKERHGYFHWSGGGPNYPSLRRRP